MKQIDFGFSFDLHIYHYFYMINMKSLSVESTSKSGLLLMTKTTDNSFKGKQECFMGLWVTSFVSICFLLVVPVAVHRPDRQRAETGYSFDGALTSSKFQRVYFPSLGFAHQISLNN